MKICYQIFVGNKTLVRDNIINQHKLFDEKAYKLQNIRYLNDNVTQKESEISGD